MNTAILKKCLDELNKENPRKDYVIGMLETLIETAGYATPQQLHVRTPVAKSEEMDEAAILDARAKAALGAIKNMANQSTEKA